MKEPSRTAYQGFRKRMFRILDRLAQTRCLKYLLPLNARAALAFAASRKGIDKVEDLYAFWAQRKPLNNYFGAHAFSPRSQTILNMLDGYIQFQDSILEVGCNVGRNLNHLYSNGYINVSGIDISRHAIERMYKEYPQLEHIHTNVGPAEDILKRYSPSCYDIVFTMAVLEHIHPSSVNIFVEIARVAKKYVLVIEPRRGHQSHRQYPWDIIDQFERVGLSLVEKKQWSELWTVERNRANHWQPAFDEYDALLFQV